MSASEAKSTQAWLDECEEFIATFHAPEKLTTACPGPSAVQRCTDELLQGCGEIARKKNLPLHIHLAETKAQQVQGNSIYGHSLLQHLESLGIVSANLSCAHSIWIEESDVELFAKRGATPVHNPASNLRIGSGLAKVKEFLAAGVSVGLGTDGAASNDNQNMFDAARLVALIHNHAGSDFNQWVTPAQALAMATRNGARAFGLEAGVIAPGKLADIVLLRRDTPAYRPMNDVVNQIVFCENGSNVDSVIVNGEVVVEGGRLSQSRRDGSVEARRTTPAIGWPRRCKENSPPRAAWSRRWRKCISGCQKDRARLCATFRIMLAVVYASPSPARKRKRPGNK